MRFLGTRAGRRGHGAAGRIGVPERPERAAVGFTADRRVQIKHSGPETRTCRRTNLSLTKGLRLKALKQALIPRIHDRTFFSENHIHASGRFRRKNALIIFLRFFLLSDTGVELTENVQRRGHGRGVGDVRVRRENHRRCIFMYIVFDH